MARLDSTESSTTHTRENKMKSPQDGLGIVRDTIANSTVILDVSEDLVTSRVGVVGRDTSMLYLFKPVGFVITRGSSI